MVVNNVGFVFTKGDLSAVREICTSNKVSSLLQAVNALLDVFAMDVR